MTSGAAKAMSHNLELFGDEPAAACAVPPARALAPRFPEKIHEDEYFSRYDKKMRIRNHEGVMHFFERRLRDAGITRIAGVDEAGRGPLAGPVVASAVILPKDFHVEGLYDSKGISEKVRERIYECLTTDPEVDWAVGIIDNRRIDEINILRATYAAVLAAYSKLRTRPEFLLNDAMVVPGIEKAVGQWKIIKGDAKSASIAAASIIAKVTRDRIMDELDAKYPAYGFARHKGYGTAEHIDSIRAHGYSDVHRMTFKLDL